VVGCGAPQLNAVLDGLKFISDRRPSSGNVLRGPFLQDLGWDA